MTFEDAIRDASRLLSQAAEELIDESSGETIREITTRILEACQYGGTMTFNRWWEKQDMFRDDIYSRAVAKHAWDAALEQAARLADDDWDNGSNGEKVADKIRELKEKL